MGEQRVNTAELGRQRREFMQAVLRDVQALKFMLDCGTFETGVTRIGAEQEIFLVNPSSRPAPLSMEVLERLDDPMFTTELARFNLELNLRPQLLAGDCLSQLERDLNHKLHALRAVTAELGIDFVLTGILPTVRPSDLGIDNMTPRRRYWALNEALKAVSPGGFDFRLRGVDELSIQHDSVMLEACCTSMQLHLQTAPDEFADLYNIAQVVIAPLLAAAANSPLLFGRRLWSETRIPLFQQSIDARGSSYHLRDRQPRVDFGHEWVRDSVLEVFEQDIARFRLLLAADIGDDPFATLRRGEVPKLGALQVFNGTVYRWNRPCYGITNGKPHLRIEMRALPAGPSVTDEVANAALYYGLMLGMSAEVGDVTGLMSFDDARSNFFAAARYGLDAQLHWFNGQVVPVQELLGDDLLPLAREGLETAGLFGADIERYLGVIEDRVTSGRNGTQWLLDSMADLSEKGTRDEIFTALTAAMVRRQKEGKPVHWWSRAELEEGIAMRPTDLRVEEFMTTDIFSVEPDEPLSLVAQLMEWQHVRHMPVEDEDGRLAGLISCFDVMRQFADEAGGDSGSVAVSSVMNPKPTTVSPETSMFDAINLLRTKEVDCLPVVKENRLIGIVTEHDFVHIAARLLEVGSRDH